MFDGKSLKIPQPQFPHYEIEGNLFWFDMLGENESYEQSVGRTWHSTCIQWILWAPSLIPCFCWCGFAVLSTGCEIDFFVPWVWTQSSDLLWPTKLGPSDNVPVPNRGIKRKYMFLLPLLHFFPREPFQTPQPVLYNEQIQSRPEPNPQWETKPSKPDK